jgi:hypothetical protein
MGGRVRDHTREERDVLFYVGPGEFHARKTSGWLVVVDEGVIWHIVLSFSGSPDIRAVFCKPAGPYYKRILEPHSNTSFGKPDNEDVFIFPETRDPSSGKWSAVSSAVGNSSSSLWPDVGFGHNGVTLSWVKPGIDVAFYAQ